MKDYKRFGVMLDCSRNAVMRVSELKRFIDILEKMGYNTLQLYTEDTLEIKNEPYFGYLRGRYTAAEIKEIDGYAAAHGVELIPCIQTLAHFTNLMHVPAYAPLRDIDDILMIDEPRTYELLDNIFASLAENFTTRVVNIGMDEAFRVGLGKYLDKHGFVNRRELLLRHLGKVVEIAQKYGFKPHMWGDMFFRLVNNGKYNEGINFVPDEKDLVDDEIKKLVPEDIELVYWDYYHDDKDFYDKMIKAHKAFDREVWFAGGAWSWVGFAPLNEKSLKTMLPAMESVREQGIENVLITMWGDNGGECSFYSLLPSLYAIRQYADGNYDQKKIEEGFYKLFKLKFSDFMLLDIPNGEDTANKTECPCKTLLYNDFFLGYVDKMVEEQKKIPYAQHAAALKDAAKRAGDFGYIFDTLSKLCNALAIKATLGVRARLAYQSQDKKQLSAIVKDCEELLKRLEIFHAAFCNMWHRENKPHGWEVQDVRIGGVMQRIKTCTLKLREYLKDKTGTLKIEELEEVLLPFWGFGHYGYRYLVTPSQL